MKCLTICFDKMTINNHVSIIDNDSRVYMIIAIYSHTLVWHF
jgi:hypothetical protein